MNIKLNDLDRWQSLPKGKALKFPAKWARRVRLSVNVPASTNLYVTFEETGETRFLAHAPVGLTELEFSARGGLAIAPDGDGEFWFLTAELERTRFESVTEAFTEIVQRAPRNYDLEMMMWRAEQNANRRLAAQFAEMEKRMAEATKKGKTDDSGTGIHEPEVPGDKKAPGPVKAAGQVKDGVDAGKRKAPVRSDGNPVDPSSGSDPEGSREPAGALPGDKPE